MFKPFILVLISVSFCFGASFESNELTDNLNETSTLVTTTTIQTTTTEYVKLNKTLKETAPSQSLSSMVKEKTVANLVQYNSKLLVNQTAESSMNGRIINPQQNNNNNNNVAIVATNGLSLTLILVLIAVITVVVSAIILSALFVMRRRFSIWRLNGDGGDSKEIPASSSETNEEIKEESKCVEINEKDPELAKQVMSSVDTPVNVNVDNGHSNEAADDLILNEKNQQTAQEQQQVSPSSSSPLIEKANDEAESEEMKTEPADLNKEQVTSSSSLIVNVLNELSESVACKLASAAHSPTKSTHSNMAENTETQPLNKDE